MGGQYGLRLQAEQKQTQVSDIQAPGLYPELEVSPMIKFPLSVEAHFP